MSATGLETTVPASIDEGPHHLFSMVVRPLVYRGQQTLASSGLQPPICVA